MNDWSPVGAIWHQCQCLYYVHAHRIHLSSIRSIHPSIHAPIHPPTHPHLCPSIHCVAFVPCGWSVRSPQSIHHRLMHGLIAMIPTALRSRERFGTPSRLGILIKFYRIPSRFLGSFLYLVVRPALLRSLCGGSRGCVNPRRGAFGAFARSCGFIPCAHVQGRARVSCAGRNMGDLGVRSCEGRSTVYNSVYII